MFAKYGPVSDVYIPVDYYTRRCRGFAYVQYPYYSLDWTAPLSSSYAAVFVHLVEVIDELCCVLVVCDVLSIKNSHRAVNFIFLCTDWHWFLIIATLSLSSLVITQ